MKDVFSKEDSMKVKGISILLLLFHHLFYNLSHIEESGMQFLFVTATQIVPIAVLARICVYLFIYLSAYGLTIQYTSKKESTDRWLLKRWLSLMRPFWFVYVIMFFMYLSVVKNPFYFYEGNILYLILDVLGWSDFFGTPILSAPWWYMCLAQLILLLIPFLTVFCEKLGWGSYFIVFIGLQYLPEGIRSPYGGRYSNYFLVIVLAVICAKKEIFKKINKSRDSKVLSFFECLGLCVAIGFLVFFKHKLTGQDQWQINSLFCSVVAFLVCIVTSKYVRIKWIETPLRFLGKHSGNMFMIHAFFYTFTPQFVYWSGNAIVSFLSLVFISLVFSVVVEKVKKVIHYNEYFGWLIQKV